MGKGGSPMVRGAGRGRRGAAIGGWHALSPADERRHPPASRCGGAVRDAGRRGGRRRGDSSVGAAAALRARGASGGQPAAVAGRRTGIA